jgi:hypothetical protein
VLDDDPDEPLFDEVPDPLDADAPGVEAVSVEVVAPGEVVELVVSAVAAEMPKPRLSPTALAAIPAATRGRFSFIVLILLTGPRWPIETPVEPPDLGVGCVRPAVFRRVRTTFPRSSLWRRLHRYAADATGMMIWQRVTSDEMAGPCLFPTLRQSDQCSSRVLV